MVWQACDLLALKMLASVGAKQLGDPWLLNGLWERLGIRRTLERMCDRQDKSDPLGVRTKTWTYKSGGSPCIPTRNE